MEDEQTCTQRNRDCKNRDPVAEKTQTQLQEKELTKKGANRNRWSINQRQKLKLRPATNIGEDADRKKGNAVRQQKTRKMSYADRDRLKILLENISTIVENYRLTAEGRNNETIGAEKEKSAAGRILTVQKLG